MIRVLWQDEALIVCEKPQGVLSEGEMPALLKDACGCAAVYPVHRLDKDTGGAMVFAKTAEAAGKMSALIRERALQKEYLAVVCGTLSEEAGEWTDLLFHDMKSNKSFVVKRNRRGVREATLSYRVLSCCETAQGPLSLVAIALKTGRTHQIRVQFSHRKFPLAGDLRYGGRGRCRIALWSHRLAFLHPFTKKEMEFSCEPPQDFPWNCFDR